MCGVLVRVPHRRYMYIHTHTRMYVYGEGHYRNWIMQLRRTRSPMFCCLQAGEPGNLVVWFSKSKDPSTAEPVGISLNLSPKVQELGHPWRKSPSESDGLGSSGTIEWGKEKMVVPTQAESELALSLSFVLFRSSTDWMMPIHISEGDLLYSVYRFKILISSGRLFTDKHWDHVLRLTWASFSLIKLAYKMNHHIWPTQPLLLCSSKQLFCLINENLCYWILVMILFNLIEYIREYILSFYLDRKTEWWKFWLISLSHMSRKGLTGIERDCLWFQDPYSSQTFYIFIPLTHNIFFFSHAAQLVGS